MLTTLSIRDVVLIKELDLEFGPGLTVLTGETGAGKSILLDSLGLVLGGRADTGLIRHDADRASVTAIFEGVGDNVRSILASNDLSANIDIDGLILKRLLGNDGRSRAYINGEAVTVSMLRKIGGAVAEVHGQFENQNLLNPMTHSNLLDSYGGHVNELLETQTSWRMWNKKKTMVIEAEGALEQTRLDEDFLRHALAEIQNISPKSNEEKKLSESRSFMMNSEKLINALKLADNELSQGEGVGLVLQSAVRHLIKFSDEAKGRFNTVIESLDRAGLEVAEAEAELARLISDAIVDPVDLEQTEERLFSLRALARKHGVEVDSLMQLHDDIASKLTTIEDGSANIDRLKSEEIIARKVYETSAGTLSKLRRTAAKKLRRSVESELNPLKLGDVVFEPFIEEMGEESWGEYGMEKISFLVATNPGHTPAPIAKVASGGELARLVLALKVVLSKSHLDPITTMVFDEVDSEIGGATASAVGERLALLANDLQVLVVTHSPQVASLGLQHWRVSKQKESDGVKLMTSVDMLDNKSREEEVARMLSGAEITAEARAAAVSLLERRLAHKKKEQLCE